MPFIGSIKSASYHEAGHITAVIVQAMPVLNQRLIDPEMRELVTVPLVVRNQMKSVVVDGKTLANVCHEYGPVATHTVLGGETFQKC